MTRKDKSQWFWAVAMACCLLAAPMATAQWLELPIYLPDSLCGAVDPNDICYNSVDDKIYVNGSWAGHVVVIDCATNRRIARIMLGCQAGTMLFNPDGNKVYCTGYPYRVDPDTLYVIDGSADTLRAAVPITHAPATMCYNSRESKVYCANTTDDTIVVLDARADSIVSKLITVRDPRLLYYNPVSNKVYCAGLEKLAIIDGSADTLIATIDLSGVGFRPTAMQVSTATNKVYFCALGDTIIVIDGTGDSICGRVPVGDNPIALCISQTSNKIYAACTNGHTVGVIDGFADTVRAVLRGLLFVKRLCWAEAVNRVYCFGGQESDWSIDCLSDSLWQAIPVPTQPCTLVYSRAGNKLFGVDNPRHRVLVVSADSDSFVGPVGVGSVVYQSCYDPVRDKLYCQNRYVPELTIVDCATNLPVKTIALPAPVRGMAYNPASQTLYCSGDDQPLIMVIDCASDSLLLTMPFGSKPAGFCYDERDQKMYCADTIGGRVAVIDAVNHRMLTTIYIGREASHLTYNAQRNAVYCARLSDSTIHVIDCIADSVIRVIQCRSNGPLTAACWVAATNKLYVASNRINVIDGTTDSLLAVIGYAEYGALTDVEVSPRSQDLYFLDWYEGRLVVVDAFDDSIRKLIPVQADGWGGHACLDSANDRIYYAGVSGSTVTIVDCGADTVRKTLSMATRNVLRLTWTSRQCRTYIGTVRAGYVNVIRDSVVPGMSEESFSALKPRACPTLSSHGLASQGKAIVYDVTGRAVARTDAGSAAVRLPAGVYYVGHGANAAPRRIVVVR